MGMWGVNGRLGATALNCQVIPGRRPADGHGWDLPATAGTAADAGESPAALLRAGVREDSYGWGDGRTVRSVGAGDRWNCGRRAAQASGGGVERERSARSRPARGRSFSLGFSSGTKPAAQFWRSLAPPVQNALSSRKMRRIL